MNSDLRLGQQVRQPCPYHLCSAILTAYVTRRTIDGPLIVMVPGHELNNDVLPLENCIGGLMQIPLTPEEEALLRERERSDYERIIEITRAKRQREIDQIDRPPPPPPESTSLLPRPGSRRFGRTPATEEDQEDWKLGGRGSDELKTEPIKQTSLPPEVGGYPLGRGNMASIRDVQAAIAESAVEANGAITSIGTADDPHFGAAIGAIQEAERMMAEAAQGLENAYNILGAANDDGSVTLNEVAGEYQRLGEEMQATRASLQQAINVIYENKGKIEAAKGEIAAAVEKAAEYSALIGG